MPQLKKVSQRLAGWDYTMTDTVLQWTNNDVVALGKQSELTSLLKHPGQGIFQLVAVPLAEMYNAFEPEAQDIDLLHLRLITRQRSERDAAAQGF
jgi:hypothetical protein